MKPRCQLPGCTRASYGLLGQDYCSAPHKFRHETEQEIVAYLRHEWERGHPGPDAREAANIIELGEYRI